MKKIEAIIRPERLDPVLARLREMKYPGITITEVKGHGKQKGVTHMWRGAEYTVDFLPKIKLEVVVLDEDMSAVTAAIMRAARTEMIGDGKIFIYDVGNAIRIRTGEDGFDAI